ncbi:hypothetical protein BSGG_5313 [Bacteroides sp. D2]|nr:hypothetical protein BSGG_5313 [Bacteroides sp. D2]
MCVNRKIWLPIISLKLFLIYSFVVLLAFVWIACSEHPNNAEYRSGFEDELRFFSQVFTHLWLQQSHELS